MSDFTPSVIKPNIKSEDWISALPDVPDNLTASQLKERFDRVPSILKDSVDQLVDELGSIETAMNSKADSSDIYTKTDVYTKNEVDTKVNVKADKYNINGGFNGGFNTSVVSGGAIGDGAVAGDGFSGGKDAKVQTADGTGAIDAIQLGTGINTTPKTFNVYNYQLLNASGKIPSARVDSYTKSESDVKLSLKADSTDVYTKTEVDSKVGIKADSTDVYTKTEVDSKVGIKADSADVYTKTEVDELLEGAGGGKKYATVVMGTAAAGYSAADVDFLCSGQNDTAQLTAALQALPDTGGRILMLGGRYRISSFTISKSGVVIEGEGAATIIEHKEQSSGSYNYAIINVAADIINTVFRNLKVYGAVATYDKSDLCAVNTASPVTFDSVVFDDFAHFSTAAINSVSFINCSGLEIEQLGAKNSIINSSAKLNTISGDKNMIEGSALDGYTTGAANFIISGGSNIIKGCFIKPQFWDTFMNITGNGNIISSSNIYTDAYSGISITGSGCAISGCYIEFSMGSSVTLSVGAGSIASGNVVKGGLSGAGAYSGLNAIIEG